MGQIIQRVVTLAAASANNIATAQSAAGAQNLTINGSAATGGVATLDNPRRVIITSVGNDSGITFTVYGANRGGAIVSEVVQGTNALVATTLSDFKTVTRVATSAATAGNVTVGTSSVGSSGPIVSSRHNTPANIGFACIVTGTVNYTVECTYQDIEGTYPTNFVGLQPQFNAVANPTWFPHPTLAAQTTSQDDSWAIPMSAYRVTVNSGTGTVALYSIEAGARGG